MMYLIFLSGLSHNFKQSLINLTVNEGEIARLSCLIDSVPFPPNITWLHNGELILSDRNNTKYESICYYIIFKNKNEFLGRD